MQTQIFHSMPSPSRDSEYRFADNLKRRYNLTVEDYNNLFNSQNSCCAICGTDSPEMKMYRGNGWVVDHCHASGTVRGILCCRCNLLLGRAKDSIQILQNAIDYLSEYSQPPDC